MLAVSKIGGHGFQRGVFARLVEKNLDGVADNIGIVEIAQVVLNA